MGDGNNPGKLSLSMPQTHIAHFQLAQEELKPFKTASSTDDR
jgi:hypothetical protein